MSTKTKVRAAALATVAGIFGVDCMIDLGVPTGILYLVPIGIVYAARDLKGIRGVAVLSCVLTIAGWFVSPPGGEAWKVVCNRLLGALSIAGAAALCTRIIHTVERAEQRAEEALAWAQDVQQRCISERVAAEKQLEAYAADLARSNEEVDKFAYVASHDLQEPLRKVSACCQVLAEDYGDQLDDDAREWIEFAVDGARRMSHLISDLLSFSRVGRRGGTVVPVDPKTALERALLKLDQSIQASNAEILHSELPWVMADEPQLVQLFQHLVANSIKYRSEQRPQIEIGCEDLGEFRQLYVKDNGIGIAGEYQQRVFEIFQRLHSKEAYPGTGIGLAICKRIVHSLGGELWVDSIEGQGSTFYFTLRKAKDTSHERDSIPSVVAVD